MKNDYISRQAAIDAMYDLCGGDRTNPYRENPHIDAIVDRLMDLAGIYIRCKLTNGAKFREVFGVDICDIDSLEAWRKENYVFKLQGWLERHLVTGTDTEETAKTKAVNFCGYVFHVIKLEGESVTLLPQATGVKRVFNGYDSIPSFPELSRYLDNLCKEKFYGCGTLYILGSDELSEVPQVIREVPKDWPRRATSVEKEKDMSFIDWSNGYIYDDDCGNIGKMHSIRVALRLNLNDIELANKTLKIKGA